MIGSGDFATTISPPIRWWRLGKDDSGKGFATTCPPLQKWWRSSPLFRTATTTFLGGVGVWWRALAMCPPPAKGRWRRIRLPELRRPLLSSIGTRPVPRSISSD